MYNEEKLYSVRSIVLVHVLNFEQDLFVMRFIRIELITCSTSKVGRDKVHIHVQLMIILCIVFIIIHFCDLRMAHSGRNMSSAQ